MTLTIKRVREGAKTPARGTPQSAGLDLCACIDEPVVIPAGESRSMPTGIAIALPQGTAGFIYARSGLGIKHGLSLPNCVGVIDEDYRGEMVVALYNHSHEDYIVEPGERVAQLVVAPVFFPEVVESDTLPETCRGTNGFGSTGRI